MEKLKPWQATIQAALLAAIAAFTLTQMRAETWDRVERVAERVASLLVHVAEDPMGALLLATGFATFLRGLWALYKHEPSKREIKTVATVTTTRTGKRTTGDVPIQPPLEATVREVAREEDDTSRIGPRRTKPPGFAAFDVLLLVLAAGGVIYALLALPGCGASTAQVVKPIFDAAQFACRAVEPVCSAARFACGFVDPASAPNPLESTAGGEDPAPAPEPMSSEFGP